MKKLFTLITIISILCYGADKVSVQSYEIPKIEYTQATATEMIQELREQLAIDKVATKAFPQMKTMYRHTFINLPNLEKEMVKLPFQEQEVAEAPKL